MSSVNFRLAVTLILLASLIINVGFSAIGPTFPFLVLALKGLISELPENIEGLILAHRGALEFGILMAAFMLTRAPAAGLSGFLSDLFGRKKAIVSGMGLYFIVSAGFLISNDIWVLAVFRALQGIASAMVWPVAEAYLADVSPQWMRGKVISAYTATMSIGDIVGPGIGVAIYKFYISHFENPDVIFAFKSPMLFLAVMSLASLFTLVFLPEVKGDLAKKGNNMLKGFREVFKIIKKLPPSVSTSIKTIYVNGVINGIAMGIMTSIAIVYIIEYVVKDPFYIGMFWVVMSAVMLPIMMLTGYISDRTKKRKPFIVFGFFVGRGAFFLIPFIRDFPTLLVMGVLASMSFGVAMPIMRALQADLVSAEIRGTIFGFQQLFFNSGIFFGALFGGWLANLYAGEEFLLLGMKVSGYIIPFWLAASLGVLTAILFALYVKEGDKP